MDTDGDSEMEWGTRDRLLLQLDRMVAIGRLTEHEAQRLRTATKPSEFNGAVRDIRVRHAGIKLDAAVADGSLTRADADGFLDRLRRGEHGRFLRSRLRSLHARGRSHGLAADSERDEDASS